MSTDATSSYVADTGSIEAILILLVFLIAFALILGEIVDRVLAAWGGAVGKTCLLRIAGVGTPLQPCRSPIVALVLCGWTPCPCADPRRDPSP